MTNRATQYTIINDDAAEGSAGIPVETLDDRVALLAEDHLPERPETRAELQTVLEAESVEQIPPAESSDSLEPSAESIIRQSMIMPAIKVDWQRSPTGETGVIAVVTLPEADESDDTQDASQTVDEKNAIVSRQMTTLSLDISANISPQTGQANFTGMNPTGKNAQSHTDPAHQSRVDSAPAVSALIVEDTPEVSELLGIVLRRMGLNTASESHGAKAFARFTEFQPDLVLLDLALPDIHGWKVLDAIKEQHRVDGGKMPIVIVLTAYGDAANRLVGKLQGVHSYLIKPFTVEEVERTIWNALGQAAN